MTESPYDKMDMYENIIVNWEKNKSNFMKWLQYVCGVDQSLYDELNKVICTDEDLSLWIELFDGNFESIPITTIAYKKYKNIKD